MLGFDRLSPHKDIPRDERAGVRLWTCQDGLGKETKKGREDGGGGGGGGRVVEAEEQNDLDKIKCPRT